MAFYKSVNGKITIDSMNSLIEPLSGHLVNENDDLISLFKTLDQVILSTILPTTDTQKRSAQGSLNKIHGDWYEWILATAAWNYRINNKSKYLALLLPNKSRFNVSSLYCPKLFNYLDDLKQKISKESGVNLITSNPDFVLIDPTGMNLDPKYSNLLTDYSRSNIIMLDEAYKDFISKCDLNNIVGYLAVKTSFRPDRILQIPHEGSLMKAMYIHLQTRDWVINPKGLKYYAASMKIGPAHHTALNTVATHSITTVLSKPEKAVDQAFELIDINSAELAFKKILN